jgi:hypothetical protein
MLSESPSPYPAFPVFIWGRAKCRAQSAIEPVRQTIQDIAPPPPPAPVNRRTSLSSRAVKGVLVKRKSESQGGDTKRRRSSVTESPGIESPSGTSQQSPTTTKPSPTPVTKITTSPTATTKAASLPIATSVSPKNEALKSGLTGFDQYSDSDSE